MSFLSVLLLRGYTAPEYAIRGELSEKADIYSFGVLVLEIISNRKNTDLSLLSEKQYLPEYVRIIIFAVIIECFSIIYDLNSDLITFAP